MSEFLRQHSGLSAVKLAFLIYPPGNIIDRSDRCQTPIALTASQAARPPLDLAMMAAPLRNAGILCICRDYPVESGGWSRFMTDFESIRPDMLVVSLTSFSYHQDMRAITWAKSIKPNVLTCAKGAHFGKLHRTMMLEFPALDVAIRAESERCIAELLQKPWNDIEGISFRNAEGEIVETKDAAPVLDLDSLPVAARELTAWPLYRLPGSRRPYTTILAARGCPFSCLYCLVEHVSGHAVAHRSPASLVAEIRECVERFSIRDFLIKADTFTVNRKWVIEFCQILMDSQLDVNWFTNTRPDTIDPELAQLLRQAGCWMLAMGVESGCQETLDKIGKKISLDAIRHGVAACKQAGIQVFLYFTIGLPWDTVATIRRSLAFARELDGDYVEFHPIFPFPGTEIHEIGTREKLFTPIDDYEGPIRPEHFCRSQTVSISTINALRIYGLVRFYGRPAFLIRHLREQGLQRTARLLVFGTLKLSQSIVVTAIRPLLRMIRNAW